MWDNSRAPFKYEPQLSRRLEKMINKLEMVIPSRTREQLCADMTRSATEARSSHLYRTFTDADEADSSEVPEPSRRDESTGRRGLGKISTSSTITLDSDDGDDGPDFRRPEAHVEDEGRTMSGSIGCDTAMDVEITQDIRHGLGKEHNLGLGRNQNRRVEISRFRAIQASVERCKIPSVIKYNVELLESMQTATMHISYLAVIQDYGAVPTYSAAQVTVKQKQTSIIPILFPSTTMSTSLDQILSAEKDKSALALQLQMTSTREETSSGVGMGPG